MALLKEKISNHPIFTEVERTLVLRGFFVNDDTKEIEFFYKIEYQKNGVDFTEHFNPTCPRWAITNAYQVVQRDPQMQPIPNPDWTQDDPQEEK